MGEVVKDEYQTDYVAGQDNINPFGLDLHNWVFPVAAIIVVLFVIGTLMFPVAAKETLDGAKWDIIASFDWFFLLSAIIFVVVSLALIFMPVGKIRLGGQDATPEFSTMSWFAMLFAAGMGIGLMFWAVAEPVAFRFSGVFHPWIGFDHRGEHTDFGVRAWGALFESFYGDKFEGGLSVVVRRRYVPNPRADW